MPLLDHFHPPLSRTHPWRAFHGAWAAAMARLLNAGVLPEGYYAVPFLDRDGPFEIDVATLQKSKTPEGEPDSGTTPVWTPPEPAQAVAVDWPETDDVRVEVFSEDGDPRLAATVELVSPRNKDRPTSRQAFVSKCADLLRRGCGVVVVDAVTTRHSNLHAELLAALGVTASVSEASLSANSYRSVQEDGEGRLQMWQSSLQIGRALPTLPLWLASELAVPLDLETSHATACSDLRIREAS